MRLFLDTANIDEIRDAARMGVLSGVTTNPTLMAKEGGVSYRERVVEICEVVNGPVSAECLSFRLNELPIVWSMGNPGGRSPILLVGGSAGQWRR